MSSPDPDARAADLDCTVAVGSLSLRSAVMTASGTAGHGTEFGDFMDLSALGAMVVKSLAAQPWEGNPTPRLRPTAKGMLNSIGLQGPGVMAWSRDQLPGLMAAGVTTVVSIWGRTVEEYREAAELIAEHGHGVVAIEVNLSCPNLEGGRHLFAHDPELAAEVIRATDVAGLPRWAKLSANTDRLVDVSAAVATAGAEAVTLINTLLAMVIDTERAQPALGAGGGGLSGPAIHPVAVRAVYEVHAALPDLPIVGVGGIDSAETAVEMLMAGASAVQVGTATFRDPAAPEKIRLGLEQWCRSHDVHAVAELKGIAHV